MKRKQFKWLMVMIGMLVALALLAPSGAAYAAEEEGTGTITAKGVGFVRIEGSGTVTINRGAGAVWVTGTTDIQTSGRGRKTLLPDGTIRLTGYSGAITVTGEHILVKIEGGAIDLTATGTGSVLLKGKGSYSVGDTTGPWTKAGVTIGY
jgi:hypothetical protein